MHAIGMETMWANPTPATQENGLPVKTTDAEFASAESRGHQPDIDDRMSSAALVARSAFGGMLMGLANLVPGISGGTMLLAAGIYPRFIDAVAEVTRFRFHFRSLLVLGCVVVAAGLGILLLAGTFKDLVVEKRWIMYSCFIGLTLGGVPVVWRMARPASTALVVSALISFLAMVALAILQATGAVGNSSSNMLTLFLAGLAGASAMILPGLSGGYLLLLLGQYVPILSAIDEFKNALRAHDFAAATGPALAVMVPVGLGVLAGVAVVGNLLQWLLVKFRKATLGALLGLLLGSIVGLWPFQAGVQPQAGDVVKGQVVTVSSLASIDPEDWPTEFVQPQFGQVACSIVLIALGFGLTISIAKIGGEHNA
jgi:putative membrane protein